MSEIQILDKPFNGEIVTIYGQLPIIVEDAVIQAAIITSNGTYNAPTGVTGYNPITVNVQPLSGNFTLNTQASTATIQVSKLCSHIIICMHTRSYVSSQAVLGQTLFSTQLSSEIVNQQLSGSLVGACSVSYTNSTITVTNTSGIYPANVQYDWWAW